MMKYGLTRITEGLERKFEYDYVLMGLFANREQRYLPEVECTEG